MGRDIDNLIAAIENIDRVRKRQKRHPGASCSNWEFDCEIMQLQSRTMTVYGKDILAALKELKRLKESKGATDGQA